MKVFTWVNIVGGEASVERIIRRVIFLNRL